MSELLKEKRGSGWVRFYRKSIDSSVWKNPIIWYVWSWCLLKASHQNHTFPFNGGDEVIKQGQFITGRSKATRELRNISPQQWRTAIKYLKSTNRITIKSNNKFSIITIIKWEEYQFDNQQTNQRATIQQPASNQQITTYKKDKKDKKDNTLPPSADKMKTYNENDHYEEPTIDQDTGDIIKAGEVTGESKELVQWAQDRIGKHFANPVKQLSCIKSMKKAGYTIEQIKQCWLETEQNEYWQEKGIDFGIVLSQISKGKAQITTKKL